MGEIKYRSDSEMKDSGVEWIGKIPQNWTIGGFTKYLNPIVDYRGKTPEKVDEGIFLVTAKNIKQGKIDYTLSTEYIRKDKYKEIMSRGIPKIGQVLFTTEAPLGQVANVDSVEIALAQRVIKFDGISSKLNNYFLKYLIMSYGFQQNLSTHATGSTALGIKASKLPQLKTILPRIGEQQKIANFLDIKTSEIDKVIAKKEKLIEKLEEAKKSLISEVVTGKVKIVDGKLIPRDESEMKDSGVEWLEEIPSNWHVKRLKHILSEPMKYGANESAELDDRNLPRYIRITDFGNDGKLKNNTFKSLEHKKAVNFMLKEGDILFARSGATVGKTFQFKGYEGKACFAGYLIKAVANKNIIKSDFLYYLTKSLNYENWKNSIFIQATIQNIGADKYQELKLSIPSLNEQEIILDYLDVKTYNISVLISEVKIQIQKLTQAKQSLIFEAVTGKIDLRDWEIVEESDEK